MSTGSEMYLIQLTLEKKKKQAKTSMGESKQENGTRTERLIAAQAANQTKFNEDPAQAGSDILIKSDPACAGSGGKKKRRTRRTKPLPGLRP